MKILLPVDGSERTRRVLDYVVANKAMFGPSTEFIIFTAVATVPVPLLSVVTEQGTLDDYYRGQAEKVLDPLRPFAERKSWNVRWMHFSGDPGGSISALAVKEEVDLIIMGSHGHSAMGNVLMGSTATAVLARCKTPVLLIR